MTQERNIQVAWMAMGSTSRQEYTKSGRLRHSWPPATHVGIRHQARWGSLSRWCHVKTWLPLDSVAGVLASELGAGWDP